jgi:hypothetical protein
LEEEQATGLAAVERLKGEALTSMESGKRDIIERVNNALADLSLDEKNLLEELADKRLEMESGIDEQYREMTQEERNTAFNQAITAMGIQSSNVDTIRNLVNDVIEARTIAEEQDWLRSTDNPEYRIQLLNEEITKMELKNLPEEQKLRLQQLKQSISSASSSSEYDRIKLEMAKLELEALKEGGTTGLEYKDYVDMGRDMLDKGFKTYNYDTEADEWQKINEPQAVLDWIYGLPLSDEDAYKLAQDLGLTVYVK